MMKWLRSSLRRLLAGRRLVRAIERNEEAADQLDTLLREVLKR